MTRLKQAWLALVVVALAGCTSSDDAIRAVEAMGMTNVTATGYRVFGCSEDDSFHTGFTATNPQGRQVSGVVCSGWLKGSTVRFD
jgi:hypothetical protein